MIGAQLQAVIGKAFKEGNLGKASWFNTTPIEHGFVSSINAIMMSLMRIIMSYNNNRKKTLCQISE